MERVKLTALIPTYNNAAAIRDVLADVKWADEIVVVDSYSTDATVAVCRDYTDRVLQHEYINSAKQKNWAIAQCTNEWIFTMDTDERLPPDLQEEIRSLLSVPVPADVDAFRVARKTLVLGKWIKEVDCWPDYQTRLFRKATCRFEDKEVHAHVIVPGRLLTLNSPLIHNAIPSLSKTISQLDRYSRYQADELTKRGFTFRWLDLIFRPILMFAYTYLLRGGWNAGFRGFFLSADAAYFTFLTHAKLWEKELQAGKRR
jgi:glycosyltransferase involved in cell wall biosynthesis